MTRCGRMPCRTSVIIGEAVRQIPETVRERHPEIEWRKVAGVRDFIVHGYHRVELPIAWSIATHQPGPLHEVVRRLVDDVERTAISDPRTGGRG